MKPTRDTGWTPAPIVGRPRAPTDGGKVGVTGDKRIDIRFDMLLPCVLDCELYGETVVLARNVSAGGMLVQAAEVLPLGTVVTVRFRMTDCEDEIAAQAEVKHHLCLNFSTPDDEPRSARAMGLRFLDFDTELPLTLPGQRVLH
ncbi:MAG: PilZ domain-containing protein [Kofleriaceae bacterium]